MQIWEGETKEMKKSMLLVMTMVLTVLLAACGSNAGGNNNAGATNSAAPEASPSASASATPEAEPLSGSILATGSSALQPLVNEAATSFMAKEEYKNISVQVQAGGSGTGLTQVSEGQSTIGNSDVFAEEKLDAAVAAELVDHQVGVTSIAAVVHPEVGVENLTKQQMIDIFTGKVTNWNEVGGPDQEIVIVNRPASSGTRATFESYALGQKTEDLPGSIQEDSSGTVKKLVGETPGAIGYLALSYLDDTIKTVSLDGVAPTEENVVSGKYPVWAYGHMYTKGEPDEVTKAFLDYMLSDEIQNGPVVELGYIPATKMQIVRDAAGNITNK